MRVAVMTRVALMAAVTAVAAQIAVPLPFTPVPFTMVVLAVMLSGLVLGPRYGAFAMGIYLLMGAVGVPVFANFSGGFGPILGPTGGYLISYPFVAAIVGLAAWTIHGSARGRGMVFGISWGLLALLVIYACGAGWLSVQTQLPFWAAVAQGVLPFVVFDMIKVALAAAIAVAVAPQIPAPQSMVSRTSA